jgi:hypothetical protein
LLDLFDEFRGAIDRTKVVDHDSPVIASQHTRGSLASEQAGAAEIQILRVKIRGRVAGRDGRAASSEVRRETEVVDRQRRVSIAAPGMQR